MMEEKKPMVGSPERQPDCQPWAPYLSITCYCNFLQWCPYVGLPGLELIPPRQLNHSRVSQNRRVIPECRRTVNRQLSARRIESHRVADVECFTANLQRVSAILASENCELLTEPHVQAEQSIAANDIAISRLSGQRVIEAG